MEQSLIKSIHAQWKLAKEQAQQECENRSLFNMAEKYRECCMFNGYETLEQIVALYKSTRGLEFCLRYHFPSIEMLRLFKNDHPERFGVYIDAGEVIINNSAHKILLIGDTTGKITCTETRRYEIALLHGASAIVNASGWAVVAPEIETGCSIIKKSQENAIIL